MNIFGLYVYLRNKILVQQFCPASQIDQIDQIVQSMGLTRTGYSVFEHEDKVFHVLISLETIMLVVTNHIYPKRLAIKLLEEMNKSDQLSKLYSKFNDYNKVDQLALTQTKVNQVKDVMHENINQILENQIKIETIESKSEELMQSAGLFAKTSKELKNKIWWRNFRTKLYIGLTVVTILGVIIGIAVATTNSNTNSNK